MTPNKILKEYFGYDEFREGQSELINILLKNQDVLGVMPTGAGKSLCYQIPAMLFEGITIVISPLISLMRDQVQALISNGIPSAFINSSLTDSQLSKAMLNARNGKYKIIYIAPERLLAPSMIELTHNIQISMVAVDEAHCISQWGQDFRPSYLDIPRFINNLSSRPVLGAFTATATPRVREDILETLELKNPTSLVTGFDRPNLYFEVRQPNDKYDALIQYLQENGKDNTGIIYCSTRKEVEGVTERLIVDGYEAARYHAGLSDKERSQTQDDFLYDRIKIIVATNAFGMGIDKSNVRFVIHYNMPQNLESYYQEAGRAGRDGLPSDCILFYARKDLNTALFLINQSKNPEEISRNRQLLNQMERYCEYDGCLRNYMLKYFGENIENDCGNCGSCNGSFDETDVTVDSQKILSHILRLNKLGKKFMFTHTADILEGKSEDFKDLSTFGIMRGVPRHYIRRLINRLSTLGYIFDDGYLSVTSEAMEVLRGETSITIRGVKPKTAANKRSQKNLEPRYAISEDLFAQLKELRLEIAREEDVPAFIIFSDASLIDMCQKHPRTEKEMLAVSGVGQKKLEKYGKRFLELLQGKEPNKAVENLPMQKLTLEKFFEEVEVEEEFLQISFVADKLNAVLIRYGKSKTSGMKLNNILIEKGFLKTVDGVKLPTELGSESGIITVERNSQRGKYLQCLFGEKMQLLCIEFAYDEICD